MESSLKNIAEAVQAVKAGLLAKMEKVEEEVRLNLLKMLYLQSVTLDLTLKGPV